MGPSKRKAPLNPLVPHGGRRQNPLVHHWVLGMPHFPRYSYTYVHIYIRTHGHTCVYIYIPLASKPWKNDGFTKKPRVLPPFILKPRVFTQNPGFPPNPSESGHQAGIEWHGSWLEKDQVVAAWIQRYGKTKMFEWIVYIVVTMHLLKLPGSIVETPWSGYANRSSFYRDYHINGLSHVRQG